MKIDVVKAESDWGVSVDGTNYGPQNISSFLEKNQAISTLYTVSKKNVQKSYKKEDMAKNLDAVNGFNKELYDIIYKIKKEGNIPLTIGGDHTIAIASSLASMKKEESLGIIWIDSHADFNNFDSTRTGNLHGMPFSTVTFNNGTRLSPYHDGNYYKTENAVAIGTRDYYPEIVEKNLFSTSGITIYSTIDLLNKKTEDIVENAFAIATKNTNGVHISFDIDIMDYDSAPGVSVPAPNGIDEKLAFKILEEVLKYKRFIKSFDLVEYNPLNDKNDITKNIVIKFIEKITKELSD